MTLLSSLNSGLGSVPVATTAVAGIAPLATLAQIQAATDAQRFVTSLRAGKQFIGNFYAAGRTYYPGQVVFNNGGAHQVVANVPTTQVPGAVGATDWSPAEFTEPVTPATTTISPAPVFGSGTQSSPYILNSIGATPGQQNLQVLSVTISGLTKGTYVNIADLDDVANGFRYTVTNRFVSDTGVLSFNLMYSDNPTSATGTVHTCKLKIGNASVYVYAGVTLASASAVQTISAPIVTSPANSATGVSTSLTFSATAFAMASGVPEGHQSSDWELATDNAFTTIVRTTLNDTVNKTTWTPSPATPSATNLYLRVRYRGTLGTLSPYCSIIQFLTGTAVAITTPTISSPANGATGVATSPTVTTSAFAFSSGVDTHLNTDWQIASDAGFSSLVTQSLADAVNKVSWSPSGLSGSTVYYLRARHRGTSGSVSAYSATVSFTTAVPLGLTWKYNAPAGALPPTSVGDMNYANGQFLFTHQNGDNVTLSFYTSPTGEAWTNIGNHSAAAAAVTPSQTYFIGGLYVCLFVHGSYSWYIKTSPDLVTWTQRWSPLTNGTTGNDIGQLVIANGVLYVGYYDITFGTYHMMSSSNGTTWTDTDTTAVSPGSFRTNYASSNGTITIITEFGGQGYWVTSNSGASYTYVICAPAKPKIDYYNGTWATVQILDVSSVGTTYYTTVANPVNASWTATQVTGGPRPRTLTVNEDSGKVIPGVGFTIVGVGGMFTSPDGITWTFRAVTNPALFPVNSLDAGWRRIGVSPSKVVVIGSLPGRQMISP